MLRFENVLLQQGQFKLRADWTLPRGARLAVVGPSGAGKSTLLSAVAGFLDPYEGCIFWETARIDDQPPAKRPVTMLFQDHNLFGHLTAAQNVSLGLNPSLKLNAEQTQSVEGALDRVGLGNYADRRPAALSGGQQGRVALARALIRNRALWLLDEPFSALGPGLRREMLSLVSEMAENSGATVLMVTHDPDDAVRFADYTVFVIDGVAQAPKLTNELFADPPIELRAYLGT